MLHVVAIAACATLAGQPDASESHRRSDPEAGRALQHALGILEYVGGDYEGAVDAHGGVRHAAEYAEQQELLERAEDLIVGAAPTGHAELHADMRALRAACATRVPPAEFTLRLRRLHTRIVHELDVQLTPQFIPSLAVGRLVYMESCAVCHGEDGRARTPLAATLDPPPRDFHGPDMKSRLSPYLAFSLVTFGVQGTAMPSFEVLPEDERWAVAFWVLSLRHPQPATPDAETAATAGGREGTLTVRDLALATDAQLAARLSTLGAAERALRIAHWRRSLPLEIGD